MAEMTQEAYQSIAFRGIGTCLAAWFALTSLTCIGIAAQEQVSPIALNPADTSERFAFIEGRVLDAITNVPIRKADVILARESGQQGTYATATDRDGVFRFEKLEPSSYRLSVQCAGYLRQEYGARRSNTIGAALTLQPGQRLKNLSMTMTPLSTLSGRVFDDSGDPVSPVQVVALRQAYLRGRRQLVPAGQAEVEDNGAFRIGRLSPGRYYLYARYLKTDTPGVRTVPNNGETIQHYVGTFYPAAAEFSSAAATNLGAGQELTGADIHLRRAEAYRVRGQVISWASEVLGPGMRVGLQPRDSAIGFDAISGLGVFPQRDGKFEISRAPSGSYYLVVVSMFGGRPLVLARQPLNVGNRDIEDLVVRLSPPLQVGGHVLVTKNSESNVGGVRVALLLENGTSVNAPAAVSRGDGAFLLEGITPEVYRVSLSGLPPDMYLKSIRLGDTAITDGVIDLTRGSNASLEIELASDGGAIQGLVQRDEQTRETSETRDVNATVVLVPDPPNPDRSDLYRVSPTDQRGTFVIKGVVPGKYRLYCWEDVEPGSWFEPEVLDKVRAKSVKVTVESDGQVRVTASLIPSDGGSRQ